MKLAPYSSLPPSKELREWLAMKNKLIMITVTTMTVIKQILLQHTLTSPPQLFFFLHSKPVEHSVQAP